MTAAITPGPWKVETPPATSNARYLHVVGPKVGDGVVAKLVTTRPADAKAIAAVPAMVEALLSARDVVNDSVNGCSFAGCEGELKATLDRVDDALKLAGIEL